LIVISKGLNGTISIGRGKKDKRRGGRPRLPRPLMGVGRGAWVEGRGRRPLTLPPNSLLIPPPGAGADEHQARQDDAGPGEDVAEAGVEAAGGH